MAHFAQLDEKDIIIQVVVIANNDMIDDQGKEIEALGVAVCESVVGPGPWVQTSYHGNFRRRYAGLVLGTTYSVEHDAFILPQPYPSWTLDLNDPNDWVAPIPRPTDEGYWYDWNEEEQEWTAYAIEQPTP
jgi:hypothetical protein